jgi:hypothetical protein
MRWGLVVEISKATNPHALVVNSSRMSTRSAFGSTHYNLTLCGYQVVIPNIIKTTLTMRGPNLINRDLRFCG